MSYYTYLWGAVVLSLLALTVSPERALLVLSWYGLTFWRWG